MKLSNLATGYLSIILLLLNMNITIQSMEQKRNLVAEIKDPALIANNNMTDNPECPICLEKYCKQRQALLLECHHNLCEECAYQDSLTLCPLCNSPKIITERPCADNFSNTYDPEIDTQQACAICQEDFAKGNPIDRDACKMHIFHSICINKHILAKEGHASCPLCNTPIDLGSRIEFESGPPRPDEEGERLARQLHEEERRNSLVYGRADDMDYPQPRKTEKERRGKRGNNRNNRYTAQNTAPFLQPAFAPVPAPLKNKYKKTASKYLGGNGGSGKFIATEFLTATALGWVNRKLWSESGSLGHESQKPLAFALSGISLICAHKILNKINPDRSKHFGKVITCWGSGLALGGFGIPYAVAKASPAKAA